METAKVDIRKLQLLNDRIAQCFEALNQVRMSVHSVQGLSHTSAADPRLTPLAGIQNPVFGIGFPQVMSPYQAAVTPYGQPLIPTAPGLAHTSAFQPVTTAWDPRLAGAPVVNPFAVGSIPASPFLGANPLIPVGLSHTSVESIDPYGLRPTWADPILAARVVQTFPFASFSYLPVSLSI